jgi:hypothetical protein
MVHARIATLPKGANQHTAIAVPSQEQAAKLLNVSVDTGQRARRVLEDGIPELASKVERGTISVSAAADVARLPKQEQREIVARGEKEILAAAKDIRSKRADERTRENAAVLVRETIIPDGLFGTIIIDPPWPMQKIERDVRPNQVAFDYPVMSEDELLSFGDSVAAQPAPLPSHCTAFIDVLGTVKLVCHMV